MYSRISYLNCALDVWLMTDSVRQAVKRRQNWFSFLQSFKSLTIMIICLSSSDWSAQHARSSYTSTRPDCHCRVHLCIFWWYLLLHISAESSGPTIYSQRLGASPSQIHSMAHPRGLSVHLRLSRCWPHHTSNISRSGDTHHASRGAYDRLDRRRRGTPAHILPKLGSVTNI